MDGMYGPVLLATIALTVSWLVCTALLVLQRWTRLDVTTAWIILSILVGPFLLLHLTVEILIRAGVFNYDSPLLLQVLSWMAIPWIVSLVLGVPYISRSRIRSDRIKHGLCAKCGYDLRGRPSSAVCPECGSTT